MIKTKKCEKCNKDFRIFKKREGRYCSRVCYLQTRWGARVCRLCGKASITRFCSDKCRKDFWNKNDYLIFKKKYHWEKKLAILQDLGGKCVQCGNDDIRVLDIDHIDSTKKKRPKTTYTWSYRIKEWQANMENLRLLCANCHRIRTWEQMNYGMGKPVVKRVKSPAKD